MRLGDHFQQIKKKYHNTFFSGICFDHRRIKEKGGAILYKKKIEIQKIFV